MLLTALLSSVVRRGRLTLIWPNGESVAVGPADGSPAASMRLADWRTVRRLALNPGLELGEAYMDGRLTLEPGTGLLDLLTVLTQDLLHDGNLPWWDRYLGPVAVPFRGLLQRNDLRRAARNVRHHYDIDGRVYALFLDSDRQYSCAYFATPETDLETAQADKKRHIAAKLKLDRPGLKVLDVGSGWGGLALYLARTTGAEVTGLTLSVEQQAEATRRAAEAGLSHRVRFLLRDWREERGQYDRVVSVGMFEHVGLANYRGFAAAIRRWLAPDGVALLHSIGRMDGPGITNPWIRKYIFPGGYAPALSEVLPHLEEEALWATDIEVLRLHYAMTLRHWQTRFAANRDAIRGMMDERFCRMWEFYLVAAEMDFAHLLSMVFQIQITRRVDTLPITRDYMAKAEAALPP